MLDLEIALFLSLFMLIASYNHVLRCLEAEVLSLY